MTTDSPWLIFDEARGLDLSQQRHLPVFVGLVRSAAEDVSLALQVGHQAPVVLPVRAAEVLLQCINQMLTERTIYVLRRRNGQATTIVPRPTRRQSGPRVKITPHVACVLLLFLQDTNREWYGAGLARRLNISAATVNRIFERLVDAGWATMRLGPKPDSRRGGARRRYHRLTQRGASAARLAFQQPMVFGIDPRVMLMAEEHNLSFNPVKESRSNP